jgi:hypothetical protein
LGGRGVEVEKLLDKTFNDMNPPPQNNYYGEQFKLDEMSGTRETHRHW